MLKSYLIVFFISMLPLIELRGAIPVGIGMGLPILPTYLVCVVGNMLPVPFIYLFARKALIWGYHKPIIGPFCRFCIVKGEKGGRALEAKAGRGRNFRAYRVATMGPLSSATPRPIIQPSRISILKGSSVQPLPSGTTSTWQMVARYFSASAPASSA